MSTDTYQAIQASLRDLLLGAGQMSIGVAWSLLVWWLRDLQNSGRSSNILVANAINRRLPNMANLWHPVLTELEVIPPDEWRTSFIPGAPELSDGAELQRLFARLVHAHRRVARELKGLSHRPGLEGVEAPDLRQWQSHEARFEAELEKLCRDPNFAPLARALDGC